MALVFCVQIRETPVIFPCSSARGSRLYAAVIKEGGAQPRIKYCIASSCRSRSAQVGGLGRKVEQTPCNRRNKRAADHTTSAQRSPPQTTPQPQPESKKLGVRPLWHSCGWACRGCSKAVAGVVVGAVAGLFARTSTAASCKMRVAISLVQSGVGSGRASSNSSSAISKALSTCSISSSRLVPRMRQSRMAIHRLESLGSPALEVAPQSQVQQNCHHCQCRCPSSHALPTAAKVWPAWSGQRGCWR
jgi:hypothetical protein